MMDSYNNTVRPPPPVPPRHDRHVRLQQQHEIGLMTSPSIDSIQSTQTDTSEGAELLQQQQRQQRHAVPELPPRDTRHTTLGGTSHHARRSSVSPAVLAYTSPSMTDLSLREHTDDTRMRARHHAALSQQLEAAGLREWRKSLSHLAPTQYHDYGKPLPALPGKLGPPTSGPFGWLADKYRRYRRAILLSGVLFGIGLLIAIVLAALGRFGIGQDGQTANDDVGRRGLAMRGRGDGTYYDPGVGVSSCEWSYTNNDLVAAMNAPQFGSYARPSNSPVCGACIKVTGPKGSVRVKVIDKCPVCKRGDIDLSERAYLMIADKDAGRVPISWEGC